MAKKILIGVGVVAVLFVATIAVLGAVAPTDLHVEREVVIDRPKEVVFEDLKYFKSHERWSPWFKRDPNIARQTIAKNTKIPPEVVQKMHLGRWTTSSSLADMQFWIDAARKEGLITSSNIKVDDMVWKGK